MAYCTVNGVSVSAAHITLPRVGVWHAELQVPDGTVKSGRVSISYADAQLKLNGTVRYGGVEEGSSEIHVVGGAGGWPSPMKPRAYRDAPRQIVLNDILAAAGEALSTTTDRTWLGARLPFWNIMQTTAGNALQLLVARQDGISWRVLKDGSLFVGPETWPVVAPAFQVLSKQPRDYTAKLDMESPTLLPGVTLAGQRVSAVEYVLEEKDRYVLVHFEAP